MAIVSVVGVAELGWLMGLIPVAFVGVLGSVYVFAFRSMSREEREESYRPAWYKWYRQHQERRLASTSHTQQDDG